jgi:hypothetical protein
MRTRFGSKIKMVRPPDKEGWAKFRYFEDDGTGKIKEWHVSEIIPESQGELEQLYKAQYERR